MKKTSFKKLPQLKEYVVVLIIDFNIEIVNSYTARVY